jgi:arylsulfatase A-like enzyme
MRNRAIGVLAVVVMLGVAGYVAFENYWYYLPALITKLRDPIQPNREVVWEEGPAVAAASPGDRPPNIVLIVADDLGFNDLTFAGGGVADGAVPTPNIDSIAREGVNLSRAYAGDATCAPSRAALMTGRYATRFGFEFTPVPMLFARRLGKAGTPSHPALYHPELEKDVPPMAEMTVPTSERMLPQLLAARGYHTMMLGKWHLGETVTTRPEARGFDEFLGFLPGAAMFLPPGDPAVVDARLDFDPVDKVLWANLAYAVVNNGGTERFEPSRYMTDYLSDEAVKAIEANRNRPFFLYLAYNAPHTPLQALRSDYDALPGIASHRLRVYAAMIRALDRGVGKVLDALKVHGLDDNTLVIFTSDNGGTSFVGLPDINRPYRGWKATFFEGGIRVPLLARWPARIAQGERSDFAAAHVDIFATAVAAAGGDLPADRKMDGVNLLPWIAGEARGAPHESLYWRSGRYKTVLVGDWKLQESANPEAQWLFDLGADPTERSDRSQARPEKLAALTALLSRIDAEQSEPLWPSLSETPVPIDRSLDAPERPGEAYVYWAN